jgi:Glycosyl transferases group 1
MNILLVNQLWFADELRGFGHTVKSVGFSEEFDVRVPWTLLHIDSILQQFPGGFSPDVIIWFDNSAPILISGLEESDAPIIGYSVDTHHHAELHSVIGHIFDHLYSAQRDFMPELQSRGLCAEWMPLWASRIVESSSEKKYGATFVGNLNVKLNPERVVFFEELQKVVPIHIAHGEYWKIFPHAEVTVNQTVKGDLNFRVFESMMCGSALLTEESENGLLELFNDGEHLRTYPKNDVLGAAAAIREMCGNIAETRRMAMRGRERILQAHLPIHRATVIEQRLRTLTRVTRPARFLGAMSNYAALSISMERQGLPHFNIALLAALKAATTGLNAREQLNPVHTYYLITAAIRYDRLSRGNAGQTLILDFATEAESNLPLQYAAVRYLLNSGQGEAAAAKARTVFQARPEEVYRQADSLVLSLLESI